MYHRADNEDDRVLQACLRVRSTANGATGAAAAAVVLYTNDRNLANKSIASGIDAYRSVASLSNFLMLIRSRALLTLICTASMTADSSIAAPCP